MLKSTLRSLLMVALIAMFSQTAQAALVAYWSFDDGSPSSTASESVAGNDGTLTNMDPNTDWIVDHTGSGNSALDFDGTDDHVMVGNVAALNMNKQSPMTITGWLYHDGGTYVTNNTLGIAGTLDNTSPNDGWGVVLSGAILQFEMRATSSDGTTDRLRERTTAALAANQWVFFAVSYDGSDSTNGVTIYVNNTTPATTVTSNDAGGSLPTDHNFGIGAYTGAGVGRYFDGQLDDISIWNEALDAQQIEDIRVNGIVPEPASLGLLALGGLMLLPRRRH